MRKNNSWQVLMSRVPLGAFPEREQTIINNLIRKSIISKVQHNGNDNGDTE